MNQAGFTPMLEAPRRWDVLASFMLEQGYSTFVEVGCKEGRTTGHILKNVPDSRVVAIDPWAPVPNSKETYKDWDYAKIEREFWENVGEHKERCWMERMTSEMAAKGGGAFPIQSADIVFIDAAHDYENVMKDIRLWWPHLRIGGMLCGHDFNHKWPGVERAVADSFTLMDVGVAPDSVWFVVKSREGMIRE